MAARFLNRIAGVGTAVGLGGFLVQECIYDGAFALRYDIVALHVDLSVYRFVASRRSECATGYWACMAID